MATCENLLQTFHLSQSH